MGLFDLFRPKWKHSDGDVRLAAAKEVEDLGILVEMCCTDRDWFVRQGVFSILRERQPPEEIFARLAKEADDTEIRRKAVKLLHDEKALEYVAQNDKYRYIREAAEYRLEELRKDFFKDDQQTSAASRQTAQEAAGPESSPSQA